MSVMYFYSNDRTFLTTVLFQIQFKKYLLYQQNTILNKFVTEPLRQPFYEPQLNIIFITLQNLIFY